MFGNFPFFQILDLSIQLYKYVTALSRTVQLQFVFKSLSVVTGKEER